MANMQIIYWRDIPTTVQIREGRKRFTANLPERFEKAVDAAAMKDGETDTDAYLAEFVRTDPVEVHGDDLQALADAKARFDEIAEQINGSDDGGASRPTEARRE